MWFSFLLPLKQFHLEVQQGTVFSFSQFSLAVIYEMVAQGLQSLINVFLNVINLSLRENVNHLEKNDKM